MTWHTRVWKNPVILKDVRTRMRGNRAFIILTAHLVFLALVLGLAYLVFRSSASVAMSLEEQRIFGKAVFGLLVWTELIIISFIAPGLTAGAISAERERQTYDLLRVTLLPARSLVLGKYLSGILFISLLLITSIPLYGPAFLFGSVLTEELLISILVLVITAITFCAIGIFFSSLTSRTLVSTVLSYAIVIFLVFGIPMIFLILLFLFNAIINVGVSQFDLGAQVLLIYAGWALVSITPMATLIGTEVILLEEGSAFAASIPLDNEINITLVSPWIPYVLVYLLVSIILLWVSIQLVKRVEK